MPGKTNQTVIEPVSFVFFHCDGCPLGCDASISCVPGLEKYNQKIRQVCLKYSDKSKIVNWKKVNNQ